MDLSKAKNLTSHQLLHYGKCERNVGPRGGVTSHHEVWRVNGQIKRWKRNPLRIQVPLKRGLWEYGYLDETNLEHFHLASECPCLTNENK